MAHRRSTPPAAPEACRLPGGTLWAREGPTGEFTLGLTRSASERLGRPVHFRGPPDGSRIAAGAPAVSLESEKWVGHLASPAAGTVLGTNPRVLADPTLIRRDPEGAGWLIRLRPDRPEALRAVAAGVTGAPPPVGGTAPGQR